MARQFMAVAVAGVLVAALAFALGLALRAAGLEAAANIAQIVSLGPLLVGLTGWAASRHDATEKAAAEQRLRLAELLRTIADAQGLTDNELSGLLNEWSRDAIDAFMTGKQVPEWNFVTAFAILIAGEDQWRREALERRIRVFWEQAAGPSAPREAVTLHTKSDGARVEPASTGDWLVALRRVTSSRLLARRAVESVRHYESITRGLLDLVDQLATTVNMLTIDRDNLLRELAALHNDPASNESPTDVVGELENLRRQLQDARRRLSAAERVECENPDWCC